MIVDLIRLPEEGERFRGEEPSSIIDLGEKGEFHALGPVRYDLKVVVIAGEMIVRGEVAVQVECLCSRCGEPVVAEARDGQFEVVRDVSGLESVDLTGEIREASIIAFPSYPVCRDSCKGLCPTCGVNLNQESCACRPPGDKRWGALDRLSLN